MFISIELLKDYCDFKNYDLNRRMVKGYRVINDTVYIKWTSIQDEDVTGEHWATMIELLSFVYMKVKEIK